MNKYFTLFGLSWQKQLEVRSDFFFERVRSLSVLFSLYFLWSALLSNRDGILGYDRSQLLTYVLVMTLLRAWVLSCVTDRIPQEIAKGNLSDLLLRPISPMGFWATQDIANKCLNLIAALFEVILFAWAVKAPLYVPQHAAAWVGFIAATLGAMILYFQMSFLLGVIGFWTAQSWGPRFCFEIILEFGAGAYFPIDVLPGGFQKVLSFLPFPYLVFHPLSIYLEKTPTHSIGMVLLSQWIWIFLLGVGVHYFWRKGLRHYAAEGR